jgi:hypothetical protein
MQSIRKISHGSTGQPAKQQLTVQKLQSTKPDGRLSDCIARVLDARSDMTVAWLTGVLRMVTEQTATYKQRVARFC